MTIDNRWYDDLGDGWWDLSGPVAPLHDLNPARFDYFKRVAGDLEGARVLDVGCGGGILADNFARAGASVTGVDLSHASLTSANRHGRGCSLEMDFVNAKGESIPFADSSFDMVVTSDFLEHVRDLEGVVRECARVLRPGGLFMYETVNRTLRARLVAVWLLERVLRLIPKNTHDPRMFIRPHDLHEMMARHGIENRETRGVGPVAGPARALIGFIRRGSAGAFKITGDTSISYIGFGKKVC
ncbi:MAG TPA: bifunctional 2-polyprenyl-6-hydroxyphenol methylase/3-demethylubiquinol 3-O-methyltransferase UbiG [Blastocatellia bacterium]|jgi:2-polyprenyl-6-hydroxyphenyl methylase/3-demethylubiquinone-9 3-methyltransferase|nr:bifunctional 2-polyprenyl-6-hydroxyphenol methylase/3-demethylubiquinol 3-O-methyltransferase UbiG [Blastocatellia bacterium]